jgi:hypothetical protein
MHCDYFLISYSRGGWVLQWNGQELSSFPKRCKAVRAANAAARIAVARGRAVEIAAQDETDETASLPEAPRLRQRLRG